MTGDDRTLLAVATRDASWDGRFVVGVTTAGTYCRPSCPGRTPLPVNCQIFPSAAAATAAGYQPCLTCAPDAAAGARPIGSLGGRAAQAVRLIADGVADSGGVDALARTVGITPRHLHRILVDEVGAGPQHLAVARRSHVARVLIDHTTLALHAVALSAGFGSVRQFNDVMVEQFGAPAGMLRRSRGTAGEGRVPPSGPTVVVRLPHTEPLAQAPLARFLASHLVPGTEREADGRHLRALRTDHGPAVVEVRWGTPLTVRLTLPDADAVESVLVRVRRWLDLDAPASTIDARLSLVERLAPLVAARPGLRLPGTPDPAQTAITTVLGQQVSVAAARTFGGRLVAHLAPAGPSDLRPFPDVDAIAAADPGALQRAVGLTAARTRTLLDVAGVLAAGLDIGPDADAVEVRSALLAVGGVGPWTADYIALRCLGDPDGYVPGDLVLRKSLGGGRPVPPAEAESIAEAWRPWRGYGLMHIWTQAAYG